MVTCHHCSWKNGKFNYFTLMRPNNSQHLMKRHGFYVGDGVSTCVRACPFPPCVRLSWFHPLHLSAHHLRRCILCYLWSQCANYDFSSFFSLGRVGKRQPVRRYPNNMKLHGNLEIDKFSLSACFARLLSFPTVAQVSDCGTEFLSAWAFCWDCIAWIVSVPLPPYSTPV